MSWWTRLHPRFNKQNPGGLRADPAGEVAAERSQEQDPDAQVPSEPVPLEITDVLDLHTFAPREVESVVTIYLEEARDKGFSTVRIIHGKGTGTQRALVRAILSRTDFVASYQDAPAEAGGWGATIVWFRR